MAKKFNLSGLHPVFMESMQRFEPTLAFELQDGEGCFLFLMFFDFEDESTKDFLYIFMKRTKKMFRTKLYGNHNKGDFYIFLNDAQQQFFKRELNIKPSIHADPFDFASFFKKMNGKIPVSIALRKKIKLLRDSWMEVKNELSGEILEDAEKTEPLGPRDLPSGHRPRERTLRKLYIYSGKSPEAVEDIIRNLKKNNQTFRWGVPK